MIGVCQLLSCLSLTQSEHSILYLEPQKHRLRFMPLSVQTKMRRKYKSMKPVYTGGCKSKWSWNLAGAEMKILCGSDTIFIGDGTTEAVGSQLKRTSPLSNWILKFKRPDSMIKSSLVTLWRNTLCARLQLSSLSCQNTSPTTTPLQRVRQELRLSVQGT